MRYSLKLVALLLVLTQAASISSANTGQLPGWLTGCWIAESKASSVEECWTLPRGDMMLGSGHTFVDQMAVQRDNSTTDISRTIGFEHMRIVREADGKLAFWAIAGKQQPVRFAEARKTASEIIFENAAHDYPQRIRYWREGKELKAQTSMLDGSKPNDFSFTMMSSN